MTRREIVETLEIVNSLLLELEEKEENEDYWIDPAGGVHSVGEEDPAEMYK